MQLITHPQNTQSNNSIKSNEHNLRYQRERERTLLTGPKPPSPNLFLAEKLLVAREMLSKLKIRKSGLACLSLFCFFTLSWIVEGIALPPSSCKSIFCFFFLSPKI